MRPERVALSIRIRRSTLPRTRKSAMDLPVSAGSVGDVAEVEERLVRGADVAAGSR